MYYIYVLQSEKHGCYYIGYTAGIKKRLQSHNLGYVLSTKNYRPWKLFYWEKFDNEIDAIRRERQLKSWKSRKAIERLKFRNKIEDPRFC